MKQNKHELINCCNKCYYVPFRKECKCPCHIKTWKDSPEEDIRVESPHQEPVATQKKCEVCGDNYRNDGTVCGCDYKEKYIPGDLSQVNKEVSFTQEPMEWAKAFDERFAYELNGCRTPIKQFIQSQIKQAEERVRQRIDKEINSLSDDTTTREEWELKWKELINSKTYLDPNSPPQFLYDLLQFKKQCNHGEAKLGCYSNCPTPNSQSKGLCHCFCKSTKDCTREEWEDSEVCKRITATEVFAINHGFEQWNKPTVKDFILSREQWVRADERNKIKAELATIKRWVKTFGYSSGKSDGDSGLKDEYVVRDIDLQAIITNQ